LLLLAQSELPQAQSAALPEEPSVMAQAVSVLHRFTEPSQKSPVEWASQSAVPQAQLALLAAVPFVMAQVG